VPRVTRFLQGELTNIGKVGFLWRAGVVVVIPPRIEMSHTNPFSVSLRLLVALVELRVVNFDSFLEFIIVIRTNLEKKVE
jgi:hypothetical protein